MLKRGITERGAFERKAIAQMRAGHGWWPVALTLLAELQDAYQEADEELLEVLYAHTAGGYGVHKMTRAGRMQALDARLADELETRYGTHTPISVHDMACSNAITSLDMYRSLSDRFPVSVQASDYFDALWTVTPDESVFTVVFDANASPVQFVGRGMVISASHREPFRYPLNGALRALLMKFVLPTAVSLLQAHLESGGNANDADSDQGSIRHVRLFHPKCLAAAAESTNFRLVRHDLFATSTQPSTQQYQVVRVMNALTPHHFDADRVREGIRIAASQVEPGGLLLLGRSSEESDGAARTTAYVRKDDHLTSIWTLNDGYEWPDLVDPEISTPPA